MLISREGNVQDCLSRVQLGGDEVYVCKYIQLIFSSTSNSSTVTFLFPVPISPDGALLIPVIPVPKLSVPRFVSGLSLSRLILSLSLHDRRPWHFLRPATAGLPVMRADNCSCLSPQLSQIPATRLNQLFNYQRRILQYRPSLRK